MIAVFAVQTDAMQVVHSRLLLAFGVIGPALLFAYGYGPLAGLIILLLGIILVLINVSQQASSLPLLTALASYTGSRPI
jgi:hypothetical protein